MTEQTITTPQGTLHYWHSQPWYPERETMFFFHGLTADHTMFAHQATHFGRTHNIILWDATGHGRSRPRQSLSLEDSHHQGGHP